MPPLYSLEDVSTIVSLAATDVLRYRERYSAKLSQQAHQTPPQFTEADLRLFAYVKQRVSASPQPTDDEILMEIENGALDNFSWSAPPVKPPPLPPAPGTSGSENLPPVPPSGADATNSGNQLSTPWIMRILQAIWTKVSENAFQTAVIAVALLFVFLLFFAIAQSANVVGPLARTEYARGLITFIIVFVTVASALILILYAVLGGGNEQEDRFNRGKEILTIFIGVLGTIVGFYFGATPPVLGETENLNLRISPVVISDDEPVNGDTVTITALIAGGTPPYEYSIVSQPQDIIAGLESATSSDGVIQATLVISASSNVTTNMNVLINVTDQSDNRATLTSETIRVSPR